MSGDGAGISALINGAEPVAAQRVDLREAGLTQREALLQVCDEAVVWRSSDGDAYATVPVSGHVEHHAIASRGFRNWMLHLLATRFSQGGRPASANTNAIGEARVAVEAAAIVGDRVHRTVLRAVEHGGAIYLDLGTSDWTVLKIERTGWSLVPASPVPILRGKRTAAFPNPHAPADFAPLRRLLAHLDDDTFILLLSWCLGALLPEGPYPLLVLGGEQGSGKSTLARLVQKIADPVQGDLLQPPGNDRDLIAYARSNRVLSFDNLSGLSSELADSLCRLATGSEIGGRALFSDFDLASFSACRPIVINGIPDLAARGDLADRAIVLRLPTLPGRITERDWRAEVDRVMSSTFAALLDALCCGLERFESTPTPNIRMADFARFVAAAEPALPWAPGAFIAAFARARQHATATLAEGDSVAAAVRSFIHDQGQEWSGLKSALHDLLTLRVNASVQRPKDWPANARWFSDRLRRAAPVLRALGIEIDEWRVSSGTKVAIRSLGPAATSAPFAPSDGSGADGANVFVAGDPWAG